MSEQQELKVTNPDEGQSASTGVLYVIVQSSVYRHNIGGVFDSIEAAVKAAAEMVLSEHDHYHEVDGYEFSVNSLVEDGKRVFTAVWVSAKKAVCVTYSQKDQRRR